MPDGTTNPPVEAVPPPTIHEAELASGLSGIVYWGPVIEFAAAVARRMTGGNVVVRGDILAANRALTRTIESAVGPCQRSDPHKRHAGPFALPHFQQRTSPPTGHTFYETDKRKARKRP